MINENSLYQCFLSLVRLGIVHNSTHLSEEVSWNAIQALAKQQGLYAIVLDGVEAHTDLTNNTNTLPLTQKLTWIGEVVQDEVLFEAQWKAAKELASVFEQNNIRTYVLKGAVVSECYPKPQHRISADMDCFLHPVEDDIDAWERGNKLIEEAGFEVDRGYYKNSSFNLLGLTVESHRFFTPFRGNKRLMALEQV